MAGAYFTQLNKMIQSDTDTTQIACLFAERLMRRVLYLRFSKPCLR